MGDRTYLRCVHCGKTEIEPFTPSRFDMMVECDRCEQPVCSEHSEYHGDNYGGPSRCTEGLPCVSPERCPHGIDRDEAEDHPCALCQAAEAEYARDTRGER